MSGGLRAGVAAQLEGMLGSADLDVRGARASVMLTANYRRGVRTPARERLWSGMVERYLARQSGVIREGRAALLTAGVPGAGKSSVVSQLGLVDEGWRRLDADVVKDYLLEDLVGSGRVEDLLVRELVDGYPVMSAELASLVHLESVAFIEELRTDCLARGENVVIEGTLSWPPAAQRLLDELVRREYREVRIVDVEVPRVVAHEQALARWWAGRLEGIAGRGGGGRFVPAAAIEHAFTVPGDRCSVCAVNVRAAFDSPPARALPVLTLTVYDSTGVVAVTETAERRSGVLQPR